MNTEHVDLGLARFSDWAFTSSVVVLVVALLLLAVELAYSRSRKVAERELVLTGAAGGTVTADSDRPGVVGDAPSRTARRAGRPGRAGPGLPRHRAAVRLHRAARPGHRRGCRGATCTSSST